MVWVVAVVMGCSFRGLTKLTSLSPKLIGLAASGPAPYRSSTPEGDLDRRWPHVVGQQGAVRVHGDRNARRAWRQRLGTRVHETADARPGAAGESPAGGLGGVDSVLYLLPGVARRQREQAG